MIRTGICYRDGGDVTSDMTSDCLLDLYVPDGVTDAPVVVFFHGGGMTEGARYIPAELQDQGWIIASADYRLHPRVHAPAYIDDAAAAVAWVFHHIADYGGSPDKVFVAGASAGGYLALLVTLDRSWLNSHHADADRIAGLISLSGQAVTHFTVRRERGIPERCALVDEWAPMYHVRGDAPPILLVTGDRELELFGRYEENAFFRRMLLVAGHPHVELHELKGADHGGVEAPGHAYLIDFINRILAEPTTTREPES